MRPVLAPLLATVRARRAARRITELTDEIDLVLGVGPRWDAELLSQELAALGRLVAREIARARRALHRLDPSEASLASALGQTIEVFERGARGDDAHLTRREWGLCVDALRAALLTSSPVLRSAVERSASAPVLAPLS